MNGLARFHDAVTKLGFGLATVALMTVAGSYCYEVVSRYVFSTPTEWASPVVSYAMIAMIFLAFPEMSRTSAHISINILTDSVSLRSRAILLKVCYLIAAGSCFVAGCFSLSETLHQFNLGISTNPPLPVPKWIVSIFIPYGLLNSSIYFMRHFLFGVDQVASEHGVLT